MDSAFPRLLQSSDVALLCLRLLVALVLFESGRRHASDPVGRAASIGWALDSPGYSGWAKWPPRSVSRSAC